MKYPHTVLNVQRGFLTAGDIIPSPDSKSEYGCIVIGVGRIYHSLLHGMRMHTIGVQDPVVMTVYLQSKNTKHQPSPRHSVGITPLKRMFIEQKE